MTLRGSCFAIAEYFLGISVTGSFLTTSAFSGISSIDSLWIITGNSLEVANDFFSGGTISIFSGTVSVKFSLCSTVGAGEVCSMTFVCWTSSLLSLKCLLQKKMIKNKSNIRKTTSFCFNITPLKKS